MGAMENSPLILEARLALISGLVMMGVVLAPLVPAILIYKIFPDEKIDAKGTIGTLTWNASGAFAGYMIVLMAILLSPISNILSLVSGYYKPVWTVEMELHGYDSSKKEIDFPKIDVVLQPDVHRISSKKALIKIGGLKRSDWPVVKFSVPGGSKDVNLATLQDDLIQIDNINKKITLLTPVVIKQVPTASSPYPPPGGVEYLTLVPREADVGN